jgi:hypothetical protein
LSITYCKIHSIKKYKFKKVNLGAFISSLGDSDIFLKALYIIQDIFQTKSRERSSILIPSIISVPSEVGFLMIKAVFAINDRISVNNNLFLIHSTLSKAYFRDIYITIWYLLHWFRYFTLQQLGNIEIYLQRSWNVPLSHYNFMLYGAV